MSPDVQRGLPPYMQVVEYYRDLIKTGKLRPGDRLPSARKLMTEWHVAIATAAKVLNTLRSEGLVITTQGGAGGTVVAAELGHTARDRMLATKRNSKIYPPNQQARIVAAEVVVAPDHVAEALDLAPGAKVIRRHRVTYRDDQPVSASTSWFDAALAEVAPKLLKARHIEAGTAGYIAQQTNRTLATGVDHVSAGRADKTAAEELAVQVGSSVLIGRNWVRDAEGDVIEYGESVRAGGDWQSYEYELG